MQNKPLTTAYLSDPHCKYSNFQEYVLLIYLLYLHIQVLQVLSSSTHLHSDSDSGKIQIVIMFEVKSLSHFKISSQNLLLVPRFQDVSHMFRFIHSCNNTATRQDISMWRGMWMTFFMI